MRFPFYGWTKPDAEGSCWLLVTVVIHLLFSLSQRKFVETDIFLYISLSQLRYPDGLKVTFKLVLAAVMIVNGGIGLFVVMCSEISWLSLQSLTKYNAMKFIVLGGVQKTSTCSLCGRLTNYPSICVFHLFHRIISLSYILFTLLQILSCVCSLCVCTRAQTHTHLCIYSTFIYLHSSGREQWIFFFCHRLLMEFSCCSLLCNLDLRASRNGEHPRVVQYLHSKYSKYHKYQRSKCLYPNIRLIP